MTGVEVAMTLPSASPVWVRRGPPLQVRAAVAEIPAYVANVFAHLNEVSSKDDISAMSDVRQELLNKRKAMGDAENGDRMFQDMLVFQTQNQCCCRCIRRI